MELEHSFTVPVPKERAWDVLLDVERVAPCMPGATLDSVDGDDIRGRIKVKVGPISMTYAGTAQIVERDPANGVVRLDASGKETRGAGTASASVRSVLEDRGDETFVVVRTTLNVTGKPAQFGRGVLNEVGGKLLSIFANNLAAMLGQTENEPTPKADAAPGDAALEDLNLPARATASLRKEGITTVGHLAAKTDEQVLAIDGIGPASVVEIKSKLAERGLVLGQPAPAQPAPAQPAPAEPAAAEPAAAEPAAAEPSAPGAPPPTAAVPLAADTSATGAAPLPAESPSAATGPAPATGPSSAAANGAAGSSKAGANGARTGTTATAAPKSTSAAPPVHQDEALNLIRVAGMPVLKRSLPVLAGVTAVFILRWRRRLRHRRHR